MRDPSLEADLQARIEDGHKIYTSGKEGIFSPGLIIGEVETNEEEETAEVLLISDLNQITFVNVNLDNVSKKE